MGISEDTFIEPNVTDRELMIEDLIFSSDKKNSKAISYALECIDKLDKIEQIVNKESEGYIQNNPCLRKIKEVLESKE